MPDQISICNMALAEIVAAPIQSLGEASLEARECGRYYSQCLKSLLEMHSWGFATRRVILAAIVNPRPGEWQAAYAMPTDVAKPLKIMSAGAISGSASWWVDDFYASEPYLIEDSTLYAGCSDAVFAYVSSDVTAASVSARFVDALVYELASRIVMPIKKDRAMKGDLIKQAETAKQRAIADDMNHQPIHSTWINDAQLARDGWGGWDGGFVRPASSAQSMYDVVAAPEPTTPPDIVEEEWGAIQW